MKERIKQYIQQNEYKKLDIESQRLFNDWYIENLGEDLDLGVNISIGELIEFLENDLDDMTNCDGDWHIYCDFKNDITWNVTCDELIDALWEAVKYKLKYEYE